MWAEKENPFSEAVSIFWGSLSQAVPRTNGLGDHYKGEAQRTEGFSTPSPNPFCLPQPQDWLQEEMHQLQFHVAEYKCFLSGDGRGPTPDNCLLGARSVY